MIIVDEVSNNDFDLVDGNNASHEFRNDTSKTLVAQFI